MERKKALRLLKDWKSRSCIHPYIEKERHLGKETGKKVCVVCGRVIYGTNTESNTQKIEQ